jgi:ankyrin repeat/IBR domain-containing protein 1
MLSNGAYLYIENDDKLSPCDLAEKNNQKEMALFLESKMIFGNVSF